MLRCEGTLRLRCFSGESVGESPVSRDNPCVSPNRLAIPDARGGGASLRVTKHPDQRKVVLSHWRDGVCVASTPIELSEVPALIGVLADALGDAIDSTDGVSAAERRRLAGLLDGIRSWIRPRLAQVSELRLVRDAKDDSDSGAAE